MHMITRPFCCILFIIIVKTVIHEMFGLQQNSSRHSVKIFNLEFLPADADVVVVVVFLD